MSGEDEAPQGPYDGEVAEDDLWFLPGPDPDEADVPPGASPLPRAEHSALIDPKDWREAQDHLGAEMAQLTLLFGELDVRLRGGPEGWTHHLALKEVAALSWWVGDRISADRLGLWVALRIGSTADSEPALMRAGWAMRRLTQGGAPALDLAGFLERTSETREGESAYGAEPGAIETLQEGLDESSALHPVVQAAMLFDAWRLLGADHTCDMEAAVLAARHAATMARYPGQGALFLPLALTGPGAFRGQGTSQQKLASWLAGAEQATLAALLQLDHIADWSTRAQSAIADLSGRTPARLIAVFAAWPLVTASLAEVETGASRAAVQRNLDMLTSRGLIREVTGQGRYRVWVASLVK